MPGHDADSGSTQTQVDELKQQLRYQIIGDIDRLQASVDEIKVEQKTIVDRLADMPTLRSAAAMAQAHHTDIKLLQQTLAAVNSTLGSLSTYGERIALVENTTKEIAPLSERVTVLEQTANRASGGLSVAKIVVAAIVTLIVSVAGAAIVATYVTPKHIVSPPSNRPTTSGGDVAGQR